MARTSRRPYICLKIQLEAELNDTRSGQRRSDLTKVTERNVTHRIGIIHPVENVEEFGSHFAPETFVNRDEFDDRKIDIFLSGSGQEITRRVAKRIIRVKIWIARCDRADS